MFGMLVGCVAGFSMGESQPKAAAPKAVASSSSARPKGKASAPSASASARAAASVKPSPKAVTISEGTWRVPQEVKPGTYRTSGADGFNCYWARLKNLSGELDGILANENTDGPSTVTILSSDKGFSTKGCHDWKRI